jgi:hypothetical protein
MISATLGVGPAVREINLLPWVSGFLAEIGGQQHEAPQKEILLLEEDFPLPESASEHRADWTHSVSGGAGAFRFSILLAAWRRRLTSDWKYSNSGGADVHGMMALTSNGQYGDPLKVKVGEAFRREGSGVGHDS